MPPRNTATTGTIGEVAPADERVALDTSGAALATAAAVSGDAPASDTPVIDAASRAIVDSTTQAGSLAAAAAMLDAPEIPREVPGPGIGAERVAERVDTVRDRPLLDTARRDPVWPAQRLVDPDKVSGMHPVDVATRVTHDGVDYAPDHPDPDRRTVLLTFKEYSELVAIGAVIPVDWPEVREDFDRQV